MSAAKTRAAGEGSPAADGSEPPEPPLYQATLWPHRSLSRRGFRWLLAALAAGLAFPLVSVWGTAVGWFLLPFLLGALALVWGMIELNYRHGRVREELRLWPGLIAVTRREPGGAERRWAANPHWVRLELTDTPRSPRYLTLSGGGRTIELGAFLTGEEREALAEELRDALRRAAAAGAAP